MNILFDLLESLKERRKALRMPFAALAQRAQLPLSTVKRLLSKNPRSPLFVHVAALAGALGAPLRFDPIPVDQMIADQARKHARRLVGMVQGTMGLEHQAVSADVLSSLAEESAERLRKGPRKKLWIEQ